MKRFGKKDDGFGDIEARLRDERPAPSDDLVQRLAERSASPESERSASPRRVVPRIRLGFAMALTASCIALVGVLGGLSGPIDTARDSLSLKPSADTQPAKDQYEPPKPPKPPKPPTPPKPK